MSYFKKFIEEKDIQDTFKKEITYLNQLKSKSKDFFPKIESQIVNNLPERLSILLARPDLKGIIQQSIKGKDQKAGAVALIENFALLDLSKQEKLSLALKGAIGLLTNGVTSTCIDGLSSVELVTESTGDYVKLTFSPPIRSAGGSTTALIIGYAEFARKKLGIGIFKPTKEEIERAVVEVEAYAKLKSCQIIPSFEEIRHIMSNLPICIDGTASEVEEVNIHKYLPRIKTPRLRGGFALVIIEGLIAKNLKIISQYKRLDLGWTWYEDLVGVTAKNRSSKKADSTSLSTFELTLGRPLLSLKDEPGSLRLRIAKSANNGLSAALAHPLWFDLIGFANIGTQIIFSGKMPKAATLAACNDMTPPTVSYSDGIRYYEKGTRASVEKVLDQGQLGMALGEFVVFGLTLPKRDYCVETWRGQNNLKEDPTDEEEYLRCFKGSGAKLHPKYCLFLKNLSVEQYFYLRKILLNSESIIDTPYHRVLFKKLAAHCDWDGSQIKLRNPLTFKLHFLLESEPQNLSFILMEKGVLDGVNHLLKLEGKNCIGELGTSYLNARIGRAESVAHTRLKPPVCGIAEYRTKSRGGFAETIKVDPGVYHRKIRRYCDTCLYETCQVICSICQIRTKVCAKCELCDELLIEPKEALYGQPLIPKECSSGHKLSYSVIGYKNFQEEFSKLKKEDYPGTHPGDPFPKIKLFESKYHLSNFEEFPKIYLRARANLPVSKDATVRLNMMNLTTTTFRPSQIGTSIARLKELGYDQDCLGAPLKDPDQLVNMKVTDLILPSTSLEKILSCAKFLDELVVNYYKAESPYYNAKTAEDLVGFTFYVLAPHVCCAYNHRIIGWANVNGFYRHPISITAGRRNLDGDEDYGTLALDMLLNYSRSYEPERIGGFQGTCLMISTQLKLKDVDDEVLFLEKEPTLPSYFYDNNKEYSKEEILKNCKLYKDINENEVEETYTYRTPGAVLSLGHTNNLYKDLKTSAEKFQEILKLQEILKISQDQYTIGILEGHLLRDLIGNSNAYFKQHYRCDSCEQEYNYPPFNTRCVNCNTGLIRLTVTPGMVVKYVGYIKKLAKNKLPKALEEKIEMFLESVDCFIPPENNLKNLFK